MSEIHAGIDGCRAGRDGNHGILRSLADWLHLAAAPTFALMALLMATLGGGPADALCSAAGLSALSGMLPMYLLMSAFHLVPWLKRVAAVRSDAGRS